MGPDAAAAVKQLEKFGIAVSRIGDGDNPVCVQTVEKTLSMLAEDALIIVMAHGTTKSPIHHVGLGSEPTPTNRLLDIIGMTGRRTDVLMLACGAGMLHEYADRTLPVKSLLVTYSEGRSWAVCGRLPHILTDRNLENAISKSGFSFEKLIIGSLAKAVSVSSPVMTLAGEGSCVLGELIAERRKNGFTIAEMQAAEMATGYSWSQTRRLCADITSGKLTELCNTSERYGAAFAAAVAATGRRLPFKRSGFGQTL
jgi:hypothetical protein